ncbi:MAG: hypothetical protein OHK0046_08840 [Anaerolineae bacterium]
MSLYPENDLKEYDYDLAYESEDEHYWTRRRLFLTIISLILLIVFILYALLPTLQVLLAPPAPTPTPLPLPLI